MKPIEHVDEPDGGKEPEQEETIDLRELFRSAEEPVETTGTVRMRRSSEPEELPDSGSQRYVTNVDALDVEAFDWVADNNTDVEAMLDTHEGEKAFFDLVTDGFGCFYRRAPRVLDEIGAARKLNENIIRQLVQLPEYNQLHRYTMGDEAASASALSAVQHIWEKLPDEVKQEQHEADEARQGMIEMMSTIDLSSEEGQMLAEREYRKLGKQQAKLQRMINRNEDKIRQQCRTELEQAKKEAEDRNAAAYAMGWGSEAGTLERVPVKERLALAKSMRSLAWLKRLAEIAGRQIRIAMEMQSEKVDYERTELEGIEFGNYLPDVMPEEFAFLADPKLEDVFYKKYIEERLMQYKLTSRQQKGRGTIFCGIDKSGSMNGNPIMWAMAVALALFAIARRQNRQWGGCFFDTHVCNTVNIKPGEMMEIQKFVSFFGATASGGTAFEPPLTTFKTVVENADRDDCDLVFITDGVCDVTDAFLESFMEWKKRRHIKIYSVLIGRYSGGIDILRKFSDEVVTLEGDVFGNEARAFEMTFKI